jgi:hypothetical protein
VLGEVVADLADSRKKERLAKTRHVESEMSVTNAAPREPAAAEKEARSKASSRRLRLTSPGRERMQGI